MYTRQSAKTEGKQMNIVTKLGIRRQIMINRGRGEEENDNSGRGKNNAQVDDKEIKCK